MPSYFDDKKIESRDKQTLEITKLKSTFTDYGFVVSPYLYMLEHPEVEIEWIYYSFEMDRITKEFDFASYFLWHDYKIKFVQLPEGLTYENSRYVTVSSQYLRGRKKDDHGNIIVVNKDIEEKLKVIYQNRIIPLFGEYDIEGNQLKKGKINFIENRDNPTGIRNQLIDYAEKNGEFKYGSFIAKDGTEVKRIKSYIPKNPEKYVIVIFDTIRKIPKERGFTMKENVDKMIEYAVEIRNKCNFTFIPIIHTNRELGDPVKLKFLGDLVYPSGEAIKDTGNLSEEVDHLITLFNPNDEKYALKTHFGETIRDENKNPLYPNLRTAHLVESRSADMCPMHFRLEMEGGIKNFKQWQRR